MSQAIKFGSGGGGSGITTINTDGAGAITGSSVSILANVAAKNCGSTVQFVATGGNTMTLDVTDSLGSTFIGKNAGLSASLNQFTTVLGTSSLVLAVGDYNNTIIGAASATRLNGASTGIARDNTFLGYSVATRATTGNSNTFLGAKTAQGPTINGLTTGSGNICIGYNSGSSWRSSESYNVCIAATGGLNDVNTLRIGSSTASGAINRLNKAFICGINGNTATGTPVLVTSGDQLVAGGASINTAQPAFQAWQSTTGTNVTGNATNYTLNLDTVVFDNGSNFNPATFTFTAPVQGRYFFFMACLSDGFAANHTTLQLALTTTGNSFNLAYMNPFVCAAAGGLLAVNGSIFCNMAAGDTTTFNITVTGGADIISVVGSQQFTYAGGYLVC